MLKHLKCTLALLALIPMASLAQEASSSPQEVTDTTKASADSGELTFYPSNTILIQGLLSEGASFTAYLLISSGRRASFQASAVLKDEAQDQLLPSKSLLLPEAPILIEPGEAKEIAITVREIEQAGYYTGQLVLSRQDGKSWNIPLQVHLMEPWEADIYEADKAPLVNTASGSWLNFILPRSIRQQGINLRIDNKGAEGLAVSNISLALKGEKTNTPFTERIIGLDTTNLGLEIQGEGMETLWFTFLQKELNRLPADTYKGELRIYFKGFTSPLSTNVTVNKRIGAFGAIILLILGIILGRWIKDLNKAKGQLELMERFVPLRNKVDQLTDTIAQKHLLDELEQLEARINTVFSEEAKAEVEKEFPLLEQKVSQIRGLEALAGRLEERMEDEDEDLAEAIRQKAAPKVRLIRDAILAGEEAEANQAMEDLAKFLEDPTEGKSRDAKGEALTFITEAIKKQLQNLAETAPADGEAGGKEASPLEQFLFRALNFLSGVKASARLRYGLMRPLVTLATFIVVLLLGFNEIYINGGDAFGSEGILDYLKLFLWGVISDVFSRSLTSDEAVNTFMGK